MSHLTDVFLIKSSRPPSLFLSRLILIFFSLQNSIFYDDKLSEGMPCLAYLAVFLLHVKSLLCQNQLISKVKHSKKGSVCQLSCSCIRVCIADVVDAVCVECVLWSSCSEALHLYRKINRNCMKVELENASKHVKQKTFAYWNLTGYCFYDPSTLIGMYLITFMNFVALQFFFFKGFRQSSQINCLIIKSGNHYIIKIIIGWNLYCLNYYSKMPYLNRK